jgi:hypothetical protein
MVAIQWVSGYMYKVLEVLFHLDVNVLGALCPLIHGLNILDVFLKEKIQQLWKLKQLLPSCPCIDLIEKKVFL